MQLTDCRDSLQHSMVIYIQVYEPFSFCCGRRTDAKRSLGRPLKDLFLILAKLPAFTTCQLRGQGLRKNAQLILFLHA